MSALVKMFHKKEPWATAPPVEQPGWTPEPWSTLWDKLETYTHIEPNPWKAKNPLGVLKYWGKFVQTPQKRSKEWLFHAGCMAEWLCSLHTKLQLKIITEFEKQSYKTRT